MYVHVSYMELQYEIKSHPFGGLKCDFLVQSSDGGGTFPLLFWNLHKIWI